MQTQVVTLTPEEPIEDAVHRLLKKGYSGAPVIDRERRVVGILSEGDCLRVLSAKLYASMPAGMVAEHMALDVETVGVDVDILALSRVFAERPVRRLPVVDGQAHLLGLVTRRDVMRGLAEMGDRPRHKTTYDILREHRD